MQHQQRSRIVYISALYDFLVTAPFASPWSARWLSQSMMSLHERFDLTGAPPDLSDPFALLFANLMGTVVLVWAIVRMRTPTLEFGLLDTVGRLLFSSWMLYALFNGASTLLVHFIVAELTWGVVQSLTVYRGAAKLTACQS